MVMTLSFRHGDFSRQPRPKEALVVYGQPNETRTVRDEQGLEFLSFPRQIRDTVYGFIFVKPTFIGYETKFTKPFYKDAITWRNLAFAGSCRRIWNESLRVYLNRNGFEFYYIRPFLEFLEKIGIRGRRLLTKLRWHHHKRSQPFIVLRYLRSCTALKTLAVFARVTVEKRKNFWWGVPLLNAKAFFLSNHSKIRFGIAQGFGKGAESDEEPPTFGAKTAFGEFETRSLVSLSENLKKVKWEVSGEYKRPDLPEITDNGMCHWKYEMIEEKKERRKAEKARQEMEIQSENQGNGPVEASGNTQETHAQGRHGNGDDEEIDQDDGYVIQNGDLVKDGVIVARGAVFETGGSLEDEGQIEGNAGDVINSNGEDADMMDDEPPITADDMAVNDGEMMLWEP